MVIRSMVNGKSKKIGKRVVELTIYPNAGGLIKIWEPGMSRLEHIWQNNANKTMHCIGEICFMHQENAIDEYRNIRTFHDIVDIMKRNA